MKLLPLLFLLLIAIAITIIYWEGANPTFDDVNYIVFAKQMLANTFTTQQSPYAYGIGFISTIALAIGTFGTASWAASIPTVLEFLALIAITYIILIKYFSSKIAFIATLAMELSTFIFIYATRVLPDMLLGVAISLMFLVYAYKPRNFKWSFIAGLIAGSTIFIHFGGFMLLLLLLLGSWFGLAVFTITAFVLAVKAPRYALFLAGLCAAILAYQIAIGFNTSIFTMAQTYSYTQSSISEASPFAQSLILWTILAGYLQYKQPFLIVQVFPLGAFFLFVILGTALILKYRESEMSFVVISFWLSFFYLFYGSESFVHYTFVTVVNRYFIAFAAPMAILAAYFIDWAYERTRHSRIFSYGLGTLMLIIFAVVISNMPQYLFFHQYPNITYNFTPINQTGYP